MPHKARKERSNSNEIARPLQCTGLEHSLSEDKQEGSSKPHGAKEGAACQRNQTAIRRHSPSHAGHTRPDPGSACRPGPSRGVQWSIVACGLCNTCQQRPQCVRKSGNTPSCLLLHLRSVIALRSQSTARIPNVQQLHILWQLRTQFGVTCSKAECLRKYQQTTTHAPRTCTNQGKPSPTLRHTSMLESERVAIRC
jgi:hypothetical protein